jgi:uncharacterized alkaline shock family protein YloU
MPHKEEKTELGSIKIHNEVIGAIASQATCEVGGVARMGGSFARSMYDLLSKKSSYKGIKIETLKDNELKITVYIIVEYGVDIPTIAARVQENVRKSVEQMTGLSLAEVDVNIQGVVTQSGKTATAKPAEDETGKGGAQ